MGGGGKRKLKKGVGYPNPSILFPKLYSLHKIILTPRFDGEKIREEEKYDGKYVLLTNSDLSAEEVALAYKGLWRMERVFRELKSTLELRPVHHWKDRRIRGHVMICFLAFLLEAALLRKLSENGEEVGFGELMIDLGELRAVELEVNEKKYLVRTKLEGKAYSAFKAVGLRPPQRVVEVET